MLSAKHSSITLMTGRTESQPIVCRSDTERLRECAHRPTVSSTQRAPP